MRRPFIRFDRFDVRSRGRMLLRPGLGLKRWLAFLALGFLIFGFGVGFANSFPLSSEVLPIIRTLTLSDLHPVVRGMVFVLLGLALIGLSLIQMYRSVISGITFGRAEFDVLTTMDRTRRRGRGSHIVGIGGGTGIATLLRGLKFETSNLTAIVTIADDGGSSGRLRSDLHIPPPGDARNCLVALSEAEPLLEELFQYRFNGSSSLNGHSLGNLLLAALYDIRGGFQESLQSAAELLALSGRVVSVSTEHRVVLMGETISDQILKGESAVGHASDPLRRVWVEPEGIVATEAALEAVRQAELIVIGPGSLYTSIIPNFLINGMREAVEASSAPKAFVCNVATQPHETDGYDVSKHFKAFQDHSGVTITHLVVNDNVEHLPTESGQVAVFPESRVDGFEGTIILEDLVDTAIRTRHDPMKLAAALMTIVRGSRRRTKTLTGAH